MDDRREIEHLRANLTAIAKERDSAYERGMDAALVKQRERESLSARAFADKITSLLAPGTISNNGAKSTPGTYPRFLRAVEHVVSDIDAASAAVPHGVVGTGTTNVDGITQALVSAWGNDAMPVVDGATLVEQVGSGIPNLPILTTAPTAGEQGGQKQPAFSHYFDIQPNDAAVTVDSTLFLNVSLMIDWFGGWAIVEALMRAAVAAEANAQIVAAMTANASTGTSIGEAFGGFDSGRYVPSVVIVPPSQLFSVEAQTLAAANVRVIIDPSATAVLVVDPAATVGWFKRMNLIADEPSVLGRGVAFGVFGKVSVDARGVAKVTAAP